MDKRREFIKSFGKEQFLEAARENPKFRRLLPKRLPDECRWLWNHFQRIWRDSEHDMSGYPIITPGTVLDYMEYYGVEFDMRERELVMRMRGWAVEVIAGLRKQKSP